MPHIEVNGARLWYEDTGGEREALVFAHGLAFSGQMFESQVTEFRSRYRCISLDLRGHGQSELTESGYDMDTLTGDAAALIEKLGVSPCHFVGWSIGGFMALRLALRKPELLRTLALIGTAAIEGSETDFGFKLVPFLSRTVGMGFIADTLMKSMFSPSFLHDPQRATLREQWKARFAADRGLGVSRASKGVIEQKSVDSELQLIQTPTLMIRGELDAVVPLEAATRTITKIAGGQFLSIPRTGHACNIEDPQQVNAALSSFWARQAAESSCEPHGTRAS